VGITATGPAGVGATVAGMAVGAAVGAAVGGAVGAAGAVVGSASVGAGAWVGVGVVQALNSMTSATIVARMIGIFRIMFSMDLDLISLDITDFLLPKILFQAFQVEYIYLNGWKNKFIISSIKYNENYHKGAKRCKTLQLLIFICTFFTPKGLYYSEIKI